MKDMIIQKVLAENGGSFGIGVKIPGYIQEDYTFQSYIFAIVNWALAIGFSLAVLMIIYAGIKYLTSRGDQSAISDAKDIILGAIIGFIVLVLIRFILRLLNLPEPPAS